MDNLWPVLEAELRRARRRRRAGRMLRRVAAPAAVAAAAAGIAGAVRATRPAPCPCTAWVSGGPSAGAAAGAASASGAGVSPRTVFALRRAAREWRVAGFDRSTGALRWRSGEAVEPRPVRALGADLALAWTPPRAGRAELLALSASDGAVVWRRGFHVRSGAPEPVEAMDGDRLAVMSEGWIYALRPGDGALRWMRAAGGARGAGVLALRGDRLYGAADRRLVCLDADDGAVRWAHLLDGGATRTRVPSLAVDGGVCAVGVPSPDGAGTRIRAIDGRTGRLLWRQTADSAVHLAVAGGRVFVRGRDLRALDAVTGAPLWSAAVGGCGPISTRGHRVFVTMGAGPFGVEALDLRTGRRIGRRLVAGSCGGVSVRGRMGYVTLRDGSLYAFPLDDLG